MPAKKTNKIQKVMHEWKAGTLNSGKSSKKVTSQKQAIAIALSEQAKANKKKSTTKKKGK
jgi:hypothetical protein